MTEEHEFKLQLLKNQRGIIARRKRALKEARETQKHLVMAGLKAGMRPTKIAKAAGVHISRIDQIKKEITSAGQEERARAQGATGRRR